MMWRFHSLYTCVLLSHMRVLLDNPHSKSTHLQKCVLFQQSYFFFKLRTKKSCITLEFFYIFSFWVWIFEIFVCIISLLTSSCARSLFWALMYSSRLYLAPYNYYFASSSFISISFTEIIKLGLIKYRILKKKKGIIRNFAAGQSLC